MKIYLLNAKKGKMLKKEFLTEPRFTTLQLTCTTIYGSLAASGVLRSVGSMTTAPPGKKCNSSVKLKAAQVRRNCSMSQFSLCEFKFID